jgi:aspartate/methionine/tyrosine aminotransferase
MRVPTFAMERMQSLHEHQVRYNLTESGVWPLRIGDLLDGDELVQRVLEQRAFYPETAGSDVLRERIASWYPGASLDNVTVMAGGAEVNFTVLWSLLERQDAAAIMLPNYMQAWGIARAFAVARPFRLKPLGNGNARRWRLDLDELDRAVTPRTRVIMVTNPNNPTGAVLNEDEMQAVVRAARRVGAWLVADEIYRGAELAGADATPTFWGRYERVIISSGVSKAFGLPGLRVGWAVAPRRVVRSLWRYHDYLSLTPSILSQQLASIALEPLRRERILERTRGILRANLPQLESWIANHAELFDYIPPQAGAIVYLPMRRPVNTSQLAERIRREESVLLVSGEQLGLSGGFRIGFGYEIERTLEGLRRVDRVLEQRFASSAT